MRRRVLRSEMDMEFMVSCLIKETECSTTEITANDVVVGLCDVNRKKKRGLIAERLQLCVECDVVDLHYFSME